ncbi:HAD family hydrolase, partial [Bacillus paranthracis]
NYVLNTMKLEPANVLVIGDSLEYDIEGAKRAQIKGVLIDRENKHVNYQDDKISNLIDLLKILNKLEKLEYYSG